MAARFWRSVLGGELALAAAIAVIVGAARHWPASLTLLVALSALALLRFLLVSSGFVLACTAARDGSFGAGLGLVVWTLIRECFHFSVAQWRMCAEPYRHLHDVEPPPEGQPARPVLLIHGLLCNRAVWRPVLARLRSAGFAPIRALDLEPLFSDIESHIAGVERELRALQHRSNAMPVSIVAHSTGGLVARAVAAFREPRAHRTHCHDRHASSWNGDRLSLSLARHAAVAPRIGLAALAECGAGAGAGGPVHLHL